MPSCSTQLSVEFTNKFFLETRGKSLEEIELDLHKAAGEDVASNVTK